jgi:hypothetical protein
MSTDERPEWNPADLTVEECLQGIRKTAALLKGVCDMAGKSDDLEADMTEESWWLLGELALEMRNRVAALEDRLPYFVMSWNPVRDPAGPTPLEPSRVRVRR